MADQKSTPKITQQTSFNEAATQPGVSFSSTGLGPSPFSNFAQAVRPAISALASAGNDQEVSWGGALTQALQEASAEFDEKVNAGDFKSEAAYRNWRRNKKLQLMQMGNKLDNKTFKEFDTKLTSNFNDLFSEGLITTHVDENGVQTTAVAGDVVGAQVDPQAMLSRALVDMHQRFGGASMAQAGNMASGFRPDGSEPQSAQEAARNKADGAALLNQMFAQSKSLDELEWRIKTQEAALKTDQLTTEHKAVLAQQNTGAFIGSFTAQAGTILQSLLSDPATAANDPRLAVGNYRTQLSALRQDPAFLNFETNLGDRSVMDRVIEDQVQTAEVLLSAINKAEVTKYTAEWQSATIKRLGNEFILSQGDAAVGFLQNAENFRNLVGAAVQLEAVARQPNFVQNQAGAITMAMATGTHIQTLDGQLNAMNAVKNNLENNQNIGGLANTVQSLTKSFTSTNKADKLGITGFGGMEMLYKIKSNNAVIRWLEDPAVPAQYRQNFISAIQKAEFAVRQATGITPEDMEELKQKKYKPAPYFETGLPDSLIGPASELDE